MVMLFKMGMLEGKEGENDGGEFLDKLIQPLACVRNSSDCFFVSEYYLFVQ